MFTSAVDICPIKMAQKRKWGGRNQPREREIVVKDCRKECKYLCYLSVKWILAINSV
jgi:hypothetical protein